MSAPTREQLIHNAVEHLELVANPEVEEARAMVARLANAWLVARARYPRLVRHAPVDIATTFEALDALVEMLGATTTEEVS